MALKKDKKKRKFESRSQEVLEKVYKKREERSRSQGKTVWKEGCPLPEFVPERGTASEPKEYELFIFPLGPLAEHGFHRDTPIHTGVGPAFDQYICMQSYKEKPCFRCEDQGVKTRAWKQKTGGKRAGAKYPSELQEYFPWDRATYVLWDMSTEESMEKGLQLWAAPKKKVHAEIAKKMHSKKKGTFIDPTDFKNGKIIMLEVGEEKTQTGTFPTYSIEFEDLEQEIPEELQDRLLELCEEAEEEGIDLKDGGLIDYFLYFPDYEEVKQAHLAGMDTREPEEEEEEGEPEGEEEVEEIDVDTDEIAEEMDGWNKFKIKKVAKERYGIDLETKGKDPDDLLEELVDQLESGVKSGGAKKPKCFGKEAWEKEECEDCRWQDECSDATEEASS